MKDYCLTIKVNENEYKKIAYISSMLGLMPSQLMQQMLEEQDFLHILDVWYSTMLRNQAVFQDITHRNITPAEKAKIERDFKECLGRK